MLSLEWLVAPRYARWCRVGGVAGAIAGALAYAALLWYFEAGPGLANPDRGEAHGVLAVALGLPFSLLVNEGFAFGPVVGHALLWLSAAATWSVIGAIVAGIAALIYYRVRAVRPLHPPAAG